MGTQKKKAFTCMTWKSESSKDFSGGTTLLGSFMFSYILRSSFGKEQTRKSWKLRAGLEFLERV